MLKFFFSYLIYSKQSHLIKADHSKTKTTKEIAATEKKFIPNENLISRNYLELMNVTFDNVNTPMSKCFSFTFNNSDTGSFIKRKLFLN